MDDHIEIIWFTASASDASSVKNAADFITLIRSKLPANSSVFVAYFTSDPGYNSIVQLSGSNTSAVSCYRFRNGTVSLIPVTASYDASLRDGDTYKIISLRSDYV